MSKIDILTETCKHGGFMENLTQARIDFVWQYFVTGYLTYTTELEYVMYSQRVLNAEYIA
jgi:hypothetical protein